MNGEYHISKFKGSALAIACPTQEVWNQVRKVVNVNAQEVPETNPLNDFWTKYGS